jgi:hypothetical protein
MERIKPPETKRHPDCFLQLREALANPFADVAISTLDDGWQPQEVIAALLELGDEMMLGMVASRDIEQDLSVLRRR